MKTEPFIDPQTNKKVPDKYEVEIKADNQRDEPVDGLIVEMEAEGGFKSFDETGLAPCKLEPGTPGNKKRFRTRPFNLKPFESVPLWKGTCEYGANINVRFSGRIGDTEFDSQTLDPQEAPIVDTKEKVLRRPPEPDELKK